jgi:tetratricopeptide (TPR) repeat protein
MPRRARKPTPALTLIPGLLLALSGLLGAGCAPRTDDRSRLYNEDGVQLFARGDYQSALESFDAAMRLDPQDPGLLFNVAQCYDRLADVPKAEQYYTACLQRDPAHGDARLALLTMYHRAGKQAEGNRMVEEWLTQRPNSADAYVLDAWKLRQEKALPQAHGRLQQALALEPQNRRALAELGILYEVMGMPDRAYVLYERILSREPNQTEIAGRLQDLKNKGVRRPLPD